MVVASESFTEHKGCEMGLMQQWRRHKTGLFAAYFAAETQLQQQSQISTLYHFALWSSVAHVN